MSTSPLSASKKQQFDVNLLGEVIERPEIVKKKTRKEIATDRRNARKEAEEKERQELEDRKERSNYGVRHMIHKPTYCVLVYKNIHGESPKQNRHELQSFVSKKEVMSGLAKSRMMVALNWLFLFADKKNVYSKTPWVTVKGELCHNFSFRLAFITLTLSAPQVHDDEFIKVNLLQPFLHWLTRAHRASYVWKAETQLNGNIHFHITIDAFIPWKSVRSKWNTLMAAHGYCKVFNDGTNDKGDSATQIKAIRNEKDHAKVVGGYLTKGSIEEKNYSDLKKKKVTMDELLQKSSGCSCSLDDKKTYTRFVDGRLWGQSASISNVNVNCNDQDLNFQRDETEFFRKNDVKNLASILIKEAQQKYAKYNESEKYSFGYDDISLKKKFSKFYNVFIHKNLRFAKLPELLQARITEEKLNRKFHGKKHYTVETLF